jgi:hypothetical protein
MLHFLLTGVLGKQSSAPPDVVETFGGLAARRRRFQHVTQQEEKQAVRTYDLGAVGLETRRSRVGAPSLAQVHGMTTGTITTRTATMGQPVLKRSFARNDNAFWALAG